MCISTFRIYDANIPQFSDEFNIDGRTFYDGDDPFFQAVDIWYGVTQDLEVGTQLTLIATQHTDFL
jgi:hypothetical protein